MVLNWNLAFVFAAVCICTAQGTAYYEITGPSGETSIQPFFSMSNFGWETAGLALAGALAAALLILAIFFCLGSTGGAVKSTNLMQDEEFKEEDEPLKRIAAAGKPVALKPAPMESSKNSTKTAKKSKRSVSKIKLELIKEKYSQTPFGEV